MTAVAPEEIVDLLPQRYPYVMLDRVDELVPSERLVATRAVRADEPWCVGHFPGAPLLPGVLQLEALTQATALLARRSCPGLSALTLTGLNKVRFRRRVVPGDEMTVTVQVIKERDGLWKLRGFTAVGEERAAEAQILASLRLGEA